MRSRVPSFVDHEDPMDAKSRRRRSKARPLLTAGAGIAVAVMTGCGGSDQPIVVATETIGALVNGWKRAQPCPDLDSQAAAVHALGWMDTDSYFSLAQTSLKKCVLDRLRERGIPARA